MSKCLRRWWAGDGSRFDWTVSSPFFKFVVQGRNFLLPLLYQQLLCMCESTRKKTSWNKMDYFCRWTFTCSLIVNLVNQDLSVWSEITKLYPGCCSDSVDPPRNIDGGWWNFHNLSSIVVFIQSFFDWWWSEIVLNNKKRLKSLEKMEKSESLVINSLTPIHRKFFSLG